MKPSLVHLVAMNSRSKDGSVRNAGTGQINNEWWNPSKSRSISGFSISWWHCSFWRFSSPHGKRHPTFRRNFWVFTLFFPRLWKVRNAVPSSKPFNSLRLLWPVCTSPGCFGTNPKEDFPVPGGEVTMDVRCCQTRIQRAWVCDVLSIHWL